MLDSMQNRDRFFFLISLFFFCLFFHVLNKQNNITNKWEISLGFYKCVWSHKPKDRSRVGTERKNDMPFDTDCCHYRRFVGMWPLPGTLALVVGSTFLALSPSDVIVAIPDLNSGLSEIAKWCWINSLLINLNKTKLPVIGVPQLTRSLSLPHSVLLGKNVKLSPVVKDLGVWIDSAITFDDHVSKLSSSCLYNLRRINRIKHLLNNKTLILIINALVFSKLFYCTTVWDNSSSKNISKLQLIHNFACRIILGVKKFDHVSAARKFLGWLSPSKTSTKYVTMVHKCRTKQAQPYLCDLFHDRFKCRDATLKICHN